jgi:hypothetical protein
MNEAIPEKRVGSMLQVIEFADTDYLVKIVPGFKNIVVDDELEIIYSTVIYVLSVATVVYTVQSGSCQTSFANFPITIYHYVSGTQQAIIMKCYNHRNMKFLQHRQN